MIETNKLDTALLRFEQALSQAESATQLQLEEARRLKAMASGAETVQQEQEKLQGQLNQMRQKAAELVESSRQASGKIDTAMGRIRSVLHSNSGS